MVFHVLNRGNERRELFEDAGDDDAFGRVLAQTLEAVPVSLLAYGVMPNHWHLWWNKRKTGVGRACGSDSSGHCQARRHTGRS